MVARLEFVPFTVFMSLIGRKNELQRTDSIQLPKYTLFYMYNNQMFWNEFFPQSVNSWFIFIKLEIVS